MSNHANHVKSLAKNLFKLKSEWGGAFQFKRNFRIAKPPLTVDFQLKIIMNII
jgi:hypothetical protein